MRWHGVDVDEVYTSGRKGSKRALASRRSAFWGKARCEPKCFLWGDGRPRLRNTPKDPFYVIALCVKQNRYQ